MTNLASCNRFSRLRRFAVAVVAVRPLFGLSSSQRIGAVAAAAHSTAADIDSRARNRIHTPQTSVPAAPTRPAHCVPVSC